MFDYPRIKENELFFAFALRFHRFRGNLNIATSFRELLLRDHWPETVAFLKCAKKTLENLQLDENRFLEEHTLIPFYRIFLREHQYKRLLPGEIIEEPHKLCFLLPRVRNHLSKNNKYLWYCPVCHSLKRDYSDIKKYHQIADVLVCAEHHCCLKKIALQNRRVLSSPEMWDIGVELCNEEWQIGIAEDVKYILDRKPQVFAEDFVETIWSYVESHAFEERFNSWDEIVNRLTNLPEEYLHYFQEPRLNKYLSDFYNPMISTIEYLILVRVIFGSFRNFIEFREKNIVLIAS